MDGSIVARGSQALLSAVKMNSTRWRTKRTVVRASLCMSIALLCTLSCRNIRPPVSRATTSPPTVPLFRDVANEVGLHFQHFAGATKQRYFPEIMGSGVALLDYNNDGALDILLVQGDWVDPRHKPGDALLPRQPGQRQGCRLFRNDLIRTGKLHFTDVTEQAGLGHLKLGYGMGGAVGDYDNDGFADLYLTGYAHSVLLHNNGNGTFTDVTEKAQVADDGNWATSAAFVDYDRDGRLDLVVTNYVDFTVATNQKCVSPAGPADYCGPNSYKGVSPRLYRNMGGGRFKDVTKVSGLGAVRAAGLGVSCADLDGDGWPDILIANDQAANTFWVNRHNGSFKESALPVGCAAYSDDGHPQANMGLAVGDIDNKGSEDVLVTHLVTEGASLFRNDGHANFRDTTAEAGLRDTTHAFTGFGADWFDYDNDGRLDLFIANGAVATEETQRGSPWPFQQNSQLFHNEGPGKRFAETTAIAASASQRWGVGRGAAFGDVNNDGRVDIVVSNNNGWARLLLNQSTLQNHWLTVRLQGVKSNRLGLGAKIGILRKGQQPVWRRCHTDGSYCSASDSRVHFGLGTDAGVQAVIVQWPDGSRETWDNVRVDRLVTMREGGGHRHE